MKVLVLGARGFVGRHLAAALRAQGHAVVAGVSNNAKPGDCLTHFGRDTNLAAWLPRLQGLEAVINCVGAMRDAPGAPLSAVQRDTPIALFQACAQAGVRRVLQLSALGVDTLPTAYAETKRAADAALLALRDAGQLDAMVLRPSLICGAGGLSANLLDAAAQWPLLALPLPARTSRLQPVAVADVAQALCRALTLPPTELPAVAIAVGPHPLTLAELLAARRARLGRRPATVITVPQRLAQWAARASDAANLHRLPWGQSALEMLNDDNVAPNAAAVTTWQALLGRWATDPLKEDWR